jgi:MFS family permease
MPVVPPDASPSNPRPFLLPVARYLGVLQFFFVLTWTVYAAFLPGLLAQVGIGKDKAAWVLMSDQILFAIFDVSAGFMADRAFRAYARLGPKLVAITALSCLAFLLLPHVAGSGHPALFLALTALWAVTSSALRAPAFALLARHVPPAETPRAAAGLLAGMALAGIASPYLGSLLKGISPGLPFALSSLTLLAVASGLVRAERSIRQSRPAPVALIRPTLPMRAVYPLLGLAALAFQIFFNLLAAPRYLQDTTAANLPWLLPVFWIGFNVATFAGKPLARRINHNAYWFVLGCLTADAGGLIASCLPGLNAAIAGQFIGGLGWGAAMSAAFGLAAECGQPLRVAIATGLLFATLALATFVRMAINAAGWSSLAHAWALASLLPVGLWLLAATLAALKARRHKTA